MPFLLLLRDQNDDVRLLSSAPSASRQEALAVLGRITSTTGFDAWDSDVLLLDLDTAVPVLLVRSSDSPAPIGPDAAGALSGALSVGVEPEVESEPEIAPELLEAFTSSETTGVPIAAVAPDTSYSQAASPFHGDEAVEFESYDDPVSEFTDEGSAVLVADDIPSAVESPLTIHADEMAMDPDPGLIPAAEVKVEADPGDEAQAAEPVDEAQAAESGEEVQRAEPGGSLIEAEPSAVPIGLEEASESPLEVAAGPDATDLKDALARTAAAMEAEGVTTLADLSGEVPAPPPSPPALAWPWSAQSGADEPSSLDESDGREITSDTASEIREPQGSGGEDQGVLPHRSDDFGRPTAAASEFLRDLEPIPSVVSEMKDTGGVPESASPVPSSASAPVEGYECADCVYVDTCPNKDRRLPKDCGSFQWK